MKHSFRMIVLAAVIVIAASAQSLETAFVQQRMIKDGPGRGDIVCGNLYDYFCLGNQCWHQQNAANCCNYCVDSGQFCPGCDSCTNCGGIPA